MKKWVKWALVGAGALLLINAVKGKTGLFGSGGSPFEPDAPGVQPGDVKYSRYKDEWARARRGGWEHFHRCGTIQFKDSAGRDRVWRYKWLTTTGAYVDKGVVNPKTGQCKPRRS
jgi:hypothetical protein